MKSTFLSREPVFDAEGFIGRQAEVTWVTDMVGRQTPQNCNLIGEPRIGKTSLLYYIYQRQIGLQDKGLAVWVRLVELPEHTSLTFWHQMLAKLSAASSKAERREPDDLPADDARALFDQLDEEIDRLVYKLNYQPLLFLIDDFDLLLDENGFGRRDLDWLRSLATRYGHFMAFVISSSDSLVALTEKLGGEAAVSPFANLFHDLPLGLLTRDDAVLLCRQAAAAEEMAALTGDDLHFLLREAGQHPDLLKVTCGYFFAAIRGGKRDYLLYEDVESDVRLDRHVRWLCRQLWSRRSIGQRQILAALLQEQKFVGDRILLNQLHKRLALVEVRNGQVDLFAEVFKYWVWRWGYEPDQKKEAIETAESSDAPLFQYISERRSVRLPDGEVRLTPLENRLLVYLLEKANQVCTIGDLLENVWGPGKSRSVVEKAVNRLRGKIEADPKRPRFILSARGEGYILRM